MELKYHKELDGVRAIAALMVIAFHYLQAFKATGQFEFLNKIAVFGQTGVSLFFVLSGFLITRILMSTKDTPGYFVNFFARRSLRIFPLYYLFLCLYYIVLPLITHSPIKDLSVQKYHWFYLQNFAITFGWNYNGPFHFWSLAVEEHFYLFWPFLVYFLNSKRLIGSILFIIMLAFFMRFILLKQNHEVFYFTFCRIDELVVGAFLAILEAKQKLNEKNAKKFLYFGAAILIPSLSLWTVFTGAANQTVQLSKFLLLSLTYFAFIGYVVSVKETHLVKRMLKAKPLLYSGKISYGLYVYHPMCIGLLLLVFKGNASMLSFGLTIISSYLIATLSYYLFEVKFLKLKKFFESREKIVKPEVEYQMEQV
ncbi:hypothetical protein A4H97_03155 [Niastella yeongjuensis]|uniref:Acyltransferase 3 domain-containing protein n=1 Tax=Niastella yeongjuensis TaxID=354355 RepID=A0A1V9EXI6_9BACT|nr:acyltransferase [Niastella yeongjuensis]OQP50838.1 hypothetical protein A4H97_03155 [Niastella yeongjuensis]SEN15346.1 Peptidoglycan/LPS O-acetylase OafA/YrhL, contains acyltransferase and SGNH-hydrolase domains [Niastella yeongjuensis]